MPLGRGHAHVWSAVVGWSRLPACRGPLAWPGGGADVVAAAGVEGEAVRITGDADVVGMDAVEEEGAEGDDVVGAGCIVVGVTEDVVAFATTIAPVSGG